MSSRAPIWFSEKSIASLPLTADCSADVVVVGAGIAGITTAYLLARRGYDVKVLDRQNPGLGMTGHTTCHIANAVDDGWRTLVRAVGVQAARTVAHAYASGQNCIAEIQARENISCDFAWVDGFLVGNSTHKLDLDAERDAATQAGVANAWAAESPFPSGRGRPALCFPKQARLHPLKYINGLAQCLRRDGGELYIADVTRVSTHGAGILIETQSGFRVTATRAVVLANNSALEFKTTRPLQQRYRSYVMAGEIPAGGVLDAVCWDLEDPYHYTRIQPGAPGDGDVLIFGGEDHKVGEAADADERFAKLTAWAREQFPELTSILAQWSGEIKQTADNLAFLGHSATDPRVFIIDGDGGLGFNHATIGGLIIRDLVEHKENPWAQVFDPQRYGDVTHVLMK